MVVFYADSQRKRFSARTRPDITGDGGGAGGTREQTFKGALAVTDPVLTAPLEQLRTLERKVASFFLRIQDILTEEDRSEDEAFIAQFFFKNYSIISENTRAAKSILKYVLNDLEWFSKRSERILECLKTLYTELLTLTIDCRELYRKLNGRELGFDFSETKETERGNPAVTLEEALHLLSLRQGATKDEIKAAFRKLAKTLHPDLNPGTARDSFIRAEQAYRRVLATVA